MENTQKQTNIDLKKEIYYLIEHYNYSEIKECLELVVDEIDPNDDIIRKTNFEELYS